jgi:hypothetical protein
MHMLPFHTTIFPPPSLFFAGETPLGNFTPIPVLFAINVLDAEFHPSASKNLVGQVPAGVMSNEK